MTDQKSINARVLANTLLMKSIGCSSAAVDKFSVWLFAGFGAAVGLLFANLDTVLAHVPATQLQAAVRLFAWSMVATVVQRYLAVVIAAGAAGAEEGRQIFAASGIPASEVDLDVLLNEMSLAFWRPFRWPIRHLNRRLKAGDFAAAGRLVAKTAQLQGVFVLAQVGLVFAAVHALVFSLAG